MNRWWVRSHRWASLTLGLLLLVETCTGAVLLYANDLARALYPERYQVTPSATPITETEALRLVQATHPELRATAVSSYEGVYLVRGESESRAYLDAFVDSGTGRINGIGPEQPWIVQLLVNLHDCGFTCPGLPGYQPWLATPLPALFGADMTLGGYLLGVLAVLLIFLAISGAITWWPGRRALRTGFTVRWRRGRYARDLDLHRVVGIITVPFLLVWGITGASFYFQWPERVYFALLPGQWREDPSAPTPGSGPMLSLAQAQDRALAEHPGARTAGVSINHPERPGGSYSFRLYRGFDPYAHWNYPGSHSVEVDSHGGGIRDWAPEHPGAPLTERLWTGGFWYGLHFGSAVPSLPRLVWLLLALTPLPLALTGLTVYLTKARSRRNRRRRRRAGRLGGSDTLSPKSPDPMHRL